MKRIPDQAVMVYNIELAELLRAVPRADIKDARVVRYIRRQTRRSFDTLLPSLLLKNAFIRLYLEHAVPQCIRSLRSSSSLDGLFAALSEVYEDPECGALVYGDAFGLKRANDAFGNEGGDNMLRAIAKAMKGRFSLSGRFYTGDEVIAFSEGSPRLAQMAVSDANLLMSSHVVDGLDTRVDFGIAEHSLVAKFYAEALLNGVIQHGVTPRAPRQYFYDIAISIAEARSKVVKAFELSMLLFYSLAYAKGGMDSKYGMQAHQDQVRTLTQRKKDSILPTPEWLDMNEQALADHVRKLVIEKTFKKPPTDPLQNFIWHLTKEEF